MMKMAALLPKGLSVGVEVSSDVSTPAAIVDDATAVETSSKRRVVCRDVACPFCTAAPCGLCGNCKFPDRKNKCIKR
jgi:hypothetical protein